LVVLFLIVEWLGREQQFAIAQVGARFPLVVRWTIYLLLIAVIYLFLSEKQQQFIYFQF